MEVWTASEQRYHRPARTGREGFFGKGDRQQAAFVTAQTTFCMTWDVMNGMPGTNEYTESRAHEQRTCMPNGRKRKH